MSRPLRWLLLCTLLVAGVWYHQAPRRTHDRFLTALLTGSESELAATVDFPAVRDNLKADLTPALDRAGRAGAQLGGFVLEQAVNAVLTPQGLAQLVTGFGMRRRQADDVQVSDERTVTTYRYRSPSQVDVRIRSAADPESAAGILTYSRSGLRWRLTRLTSDALTGSRSPT